MPPPGKLPDYLPADPFDLPAWVGETDVTWVAEDGIRGTHHVHGSLQADQERRLTCDLVAVDQAYPAPVATDEIRRATHRAWHDGQILLCEVGGRLAVLVPGHRFTADHVLDALARLAKAVGARPERYVAALRIGAVDSRSRG